MMIVMMVMTKMMIVMMVMTKMMRVSDDDENDGEEEGLYMLPPV